MQHATQAANETVAANGGEVMDGRSARECRTVVYVDVAAANETQGYYRTRIR